MNSERTNYHPVGGYIAFGCDDKGNITYDLDGAETALREVGYDVMRMPEEVHARMTIIEDDFLLATYPVAEVTEEAMSRIMDEINATSVECGWIDPEKPPFEELFRSCCWYH
jgi:hypothetical protein